MINPQILEAIKKMPNVERLEMIEFALKLMREEMQNSKKLSLTTAAEIMRSYYETESSLTEFVDTCNEDFYGYHDYA
ncbi:MULTISPECIES: hypothetical protein [unclassified Anabaena]|uniref:hypothetical protein n=1 Tax=unclassified Anabaena TaxID=2619674 RepID=UPI001446D761|nr:MULTISPECIES: hypothetical protein [unclassified Anabaena]MTJ06339.1 hypothetical protein [Anabaena sp. UHCC 0204]MTJ54571.1 hypothetical protein [Anabaena sp. UHCC 0253]